MIFPVCWKIQVASCLSLCWWLDDFTRDFFSFNLNRIFLLLSILWVWTLLEGNINVQTPESWRLDLIFTTFWLCGSAKHLTYLFLMFIFDYVKGIIIIYMYSYLQQNWSMNLSHFYYTYFSYLEKPTWRAWLKDLSKNYKFCSH